MRKIKEAIAIILTVVLLFTGIPMTEISLSQIKANAIEEEELKVYGDFLYLVEKDTNGVAEGIIIYPFALFGNGSRIMLCAFSNAIHFFHFA